MARQLSLFEEEYRTLEDLLDIVEKLNPTGGYYDNDLSKPIPMGYTIDYYRDLAFIVLYKEDTDSEEKIIDNAIYLQDTGNDLYQIYQIDGKVLGNLTLDNGRLELALSIIKSMQNYELFKGNKNGS